MVLEIQIHKEYQNQLNDIFLHLAKEIKFQFQ